MIQKIPPKTRQPRKLLAYVLDPGKGFLLGGSLPPDSGVEQVAAELES